MLNRANTDEASESDISVDPAWLGFHYPSHVSLMDKYSFTSYGIWMSSALGSKPNHTHSSSSNFHVERYNNSLHYTIDNIRWTDSGTNFKNKTHQTATSSSTTSTATILKAIQLQGRVTRHFIARKLKSKDLWPCQINHTIQTIGLTSLYDICLVTTNIDMLTQLVTNKPSEKQADDTASPKACWHLQ